MAGKRAAARVERARRLEALRVRGSRGGVIAPHRSMVGMPWTLWRFVTTFVLGAGGLAALALALPWLGRLWALIFREARDRVFPGIPLGEQTFTLAGGIELTLPVLAVGTPLPDQSTLLIAGGVTGAVFLASLLLTDRWIPLRYFLRLLAFLQATAIAFFAIAPEAFPYRLQDHAFLLLAAGLVVMALVPLVLSLTLHVFDLAFWRQALVTLALLGHLSVFLPLQALVHMGLVLQGTALVMPVLFLLFGLLLDVLVLVAFYGWALSWPGTLERSASPPPVHLNPGKASA
jgi:hypothetical protein